MRACGAAPTRLFAAALLSGVPGQCREECTAARGVLMGESNQFGRAVHAPAQCKESDMSAERSRWVRDMPVLVILAALLAGYLIGAGTGQANRAAASGVVSPAKVAEMLQQKELVPIVIQPPIAASSTGYVVVGASDHRYYVVREDGTAYMAKAERNRDLMWR